MTQFIRKIYAVLVPLLCVATIGVACEEQELLLTDDKHIEWMQEPIDVILLIENEELPRMTKMQANNQTRTIVENNGNYTVTQSITPDFQLIDQNQSTRTTTEPGTPDENCIRDLNVFFFYHHEKHSGEEGQLDNFLAHHQFIRDDKLAIDGQIIIEDVRVGRYDILVMANVGQDMIKEEVVPFKMDSTYSDLTQWQYKLPSSRTYNKQDGKGFNFPMIYRSLDELKDGIIIQHDDKNTTEEPLKINLKRLFAKVDFTYDINLAASETNTATAVTYGINNLPLHSYPFKTLGCEIHPDYLSNLENFTDEIQLVNPIKPPESSTGLKPEHKTGHKIFYVPAHNSGKIDGMTQANRSLAKSPKTATYTSFTTAWKDGAGTTTNIAYPLFIGDPNANNVSYGTDMLFEDYNVRMGYNYNINLKITGYKSDHKLVFTTIKPLPDAVATFTYYNGDGEKVTSFVQNVEYYVDVLIEAQGAYNQQLSINYTLTAPADVEQSSFTLRAQELKYDESNMSWGNPGIIDDGKVVNTNQLVYKGKRLYFSNDASEEVTFKRAFRFYFIFDESNYFTLTSQLTIKNLHTGLTTLGGAVKCEMNDW